jgi:hypothetical protein
VRDIFRRIFGGSPEEVQLLAAGERDAIVATHLQACLPPLGLAEADARKWVDYTQLPLAYAMLCAKTGDLATAERELDEYAKTLDEAEAANLKKLSRGYARA